MSEPELDRDESLELSELGEIFQTVNTAGWVRLTKLMQSLVDEAHEEMFGAVYASDTIKAALMTRWQQREAMYRAVTEHVGRCEQRRKDILLEISEREKEREQERQTFEYVNN